MSATSGPDIVSDGLVFYYDTGNRRDSYLGEPTTNLVGNPTFIGTSGTQTQGVSPANWVFSGYSGDTGFKFYNSSTSPIPLKFPNEGAVITTGPNDTANRRIYFRRTDLLPNTTYSISCWMYFSRSFSSAWSRFQYDSIGSGIGGGYFDSFASYASANGYGLNEWFLWQGTLTTEATTAQCYWGPVISNGVDILVGMQRMQVEVKPHITPFINGTRSVSGSLLDISGQGIDIDVSNASFDSNAQMTFDGTDDYVDAGNSSSVSMGTGDFTLEAVFKTEETGSYQVILQKGNPGIGSNRGYRLRVESNNKVQLTVTGDAEYTSTTSAITYGQYYHVIATKSSNGLKTYLNGITSGTGTSPSGTTTVANNLVVGKQDGGNWPFYGDIPLVKIYNKALTASEVQQNYDSLKTRFGLT